MTVALVFFNTDVFRELVVRAMIFHKKYCSDLVYIAKPRDRVTGRSHILLLLLSINNKFGMRHDEDLPDNHPPSKPTHKESPLNYPKLDSMKYRSIIYDE